MVGVFTLVPFALGGVTGVPAAAGQEGEFYSSAFQTIAGHTVGTFFLICLLASLVLSMRPRPRTVVARSTGSPRPA